MVEETLHMPIKKIITLLAAALLAGAASALPPTDGHIVGNSYVNTYFHISYTWPAMLKPISLPPPADNDSAKEYAFPLLIARQGNQPYGIVVVAEKLNVAGPHSAGIKNSGDFIDRVAHSLRPGPILSKFSRSEKKNARGMIFDELSYLQNGKPASVMATQVGQYLIVFKCNADSAASISRMENSALALRILK
jgi:hypothetical protein